MRWWDERCVRVCGVWGGVGIVPLLFLFLAFRKNEKTLGVESATLFPQSNNTDAVVAHFKIF